MSKLKVPLLSFEARGSIGDLVTYTKQGIIHIAKRIPKHFDANTEAQQDQREKFKEARDHWNELTNEEKAQYETDARPYHLTGYQLYMKLHIMSTWCPPYSRFAHYNEGDNDQVACYGTRWAGQSLKPISSCDIYVFKMKLWREGSPGTVTLCLADLDGSGLPTGPNVSEATFDGNAITPTSPGQWYEIEIDGAHLVPGTKVGLYIKAPDGGWENWIRWRSDTTSPTYPDGNYFYSSNGGSSWNNVTGQDLMFELWGCPGGGGPP